MNAERHRSTIEPTAASRPSLAATATGAAWAALLLVTTLAVALPVLAYVSITYGLVVAVSGVRRVRRQFQHCTGGRAGHGVRHLP